ncbi:hypothetical protein FRC12_021637 [Ceratobasidium sp. 428]|nr:hypothetical protein FRC09_000793 [Ceratobasidium sp. 395]KAG8781667.1 hypothetical protein FRC12_021637 [Ceratobasidium sp. 428]
MGAMSDSDSDGLDFEDEVPRQAAPPQVRASHGRHNIQGGPQPNDIVGFARACCEEFALDGSLKSDVLRTAQLSTPELMIRVYARLVSFGQHIKESSANSFLDTPEFKEHITRRLQCSLLDPDIPYYVQGYTPRAVKHIVENPVSYQISPAAQEHFMHSKEFSSGCGEVLTSFRSELKRKLDKGIEDKADIYTLCQRLVPQGYQLTEGHALRFSFVRIYLAKYNKIVWKPKDPEKKKSFWEWLDIVKLMEFYGLSDEEQDRRLRKNLRKDLKQFPVPPGGVQPFPVHANMQDWQAEISITMLEMAEHEIEICRRIAASQAAQPANTPEIPNVPLRSHEEQARTGGGLGDHGDFSAGLGAGESYGGHGGEGDDDRDTNLQDNTLHNGNSRLQGNALQSGQGEQGQQTFLHTPQEPNGHTQLQAGAVLPVHAHGSGSSTPASGSGRRLRGAGSGIPSSRSSPMGQRPLSLPMLPRGSTPARQGQASGSAQRPQQQATTAGMTQFPAASANGSLGLSFGDEQSQYDPATSETSRGTVGY